jgi:two-component system chemotaxis response regulator CheB
MPTRDIVVIGASTGGVEAISTIVAGLPADLAAAVVVVLHIGENARSHLPEILNRAGRLPAAHAVMDEPLRRGRIYVAPPGLQTYLGPGRLNVRRGPRENGQRPSIDALFRTAAHYYGPRVIGVVLSGALDDGASGLLAIGNAGGVTIVQDPSDARIPDMPANALARADAEYCLPAEQIPAVLASLVGEETDGEIPREVPLETVEEAAVPEEASRSDELGRPSAFTCPECSGTLFEVDDAGELRFRCRVGHGYSSHALVEAQKESVERALWAALRALEERAALMNKMADGARRRGHGAVAQMFGDKATQINKDVALVHDLITTGRGLEPVLRDGGATR